MKKMKIIHYVLLSLIIVFLLLNINFQNRIDVLKEKLKQYEEITALSSFNPNIPNTVIFEVTTNTIYILPAGTILFPEHIQTIKKVKNDTVIKYFRDTKLEYMCEVTFNQKSKVIVPTPFAPKKK